MATGIVLVSALLYVVGALIVTVDLDRYGVSNFDLMQARYLIVGAWWFEVRSEWSVSSPRFFAPTLMTRPL